MRIGANPVTTPPAAATAPVVAPPAAAPVTPARLGVLNDFHYLTDSDKDMLRYATGEVVDAGLVDRRGPAGAFTQQLALDRRTGELAPHQDVSVVYLRNASRALEEFGAGRPGFSNPYSGQIYDRAITWLEAHGRARTDIRM